MALSYFTVTQAEITGVRNAGPGTALPSAGAAIGTVTFTPNLPVIETATGTVLVQTMIGKFNADGLGLETLTGQPGMGLLDNAGLGLAPNELTYLVEYAFSGFDIPPFRIAAPGNGSTVSLDSSATHLPVSVPAAAVPGPPAIYRVDDYGADSTGAASSDTAVATVLGLMGSHPGVMVFGCGTYLLSQPIAVTAGYQGILGQGMAVTTLKWAGAGDCIRMYDPSASLPAKTGFISGLKIDGYTAAPASTGIHVGDLYNLRIRDLWIADFKAAGSIGALFDNTVTITERAQVRITLDNCATAVVFQCEDNETPSFDYSDWDFIINAFANQDGVHIKGSAQIIHGSLSIRGDFYNATLNGPYTPGFTWSASGTNTGAVLTIGTGTGSPYLQESNLVVSVECGGTGSGPGHQTINIEAGANLWCTGILDFIFDAGFSWTPGTNNGWFAFAGYKNVDSTYGTSAPPQVFSVTGAVAMAAGNATGHELNLNTSNLIEYTLAAGANALTFNHTGMSGAGVWDIVLVQPSAGVGTVTLPGNFYVAPTYGKLPLTAVPGARDLFRIVTYDMTNFYVYPVNARHQPQYWDTPPSGGVTTLPRQGLNNGIGLTTGQMNITYFQAPPGIGATTQLALAVGSVAAANIAHAHAALFTVDGSGNLAIVGSAVDISSILTSTFTNGVVAFNTTFVPGLLYAVGVLIAAGTMPQLAGQFTLGDSNYSPPLSALVPGPLAAIPASVASAALSGNFIMLYARFS